MLRIALISAKDISDEDVKVLFAISKMTVIDEMSDRQRYFSMEFTEFMEFICRVADHLY